LPSGKGQVTLDSSGLGTYDVTWKARAEQAEGKTSPEELIAAAHSACFSMAFSLAVGEAGKTPEEVRTKADVTFQPGEGITGIHLTLTARIPGLSQADFDRIAEGAKTGCPVSAALTGTTITLDATLEG
jgi:osmotically inducible protein OsmC